VPTKQTATTLADALRVAVRDSGLSYHELARRAKADQGTISRFMLGQRDLTLAVASRLCLVLGFGLTRVGEGLTEPLDDPPPSNRRKPKQRPLPASAVTRGQGRRVDLENQVVAAQEAITAQTSVDGPRRREKRGSAKQADAPPVRQRRK
jgi:transcriptional regulator with XRE-family HTH domain